MNKKDRDLLQYFIERTDQRFDGVEKKLDALIGWKFKIVGAGAVISFIISILIAYLNN